MPAISVRTIRRYFSIGENGANTTAQGRALESLICYLFSKVPGVSVVARNTLNTFQTEEVDVAIWNDQVSSGLPFIPTTVLIECKNWRHAVGSQEIVYFAERLRHRGCEYGVLVAANGITGIPERLTAAHLQMAMALSTGVRILVFTRTELEALTNTNQLVSLFKQKICELVVSGTALV